MTALRRLIGLIVCGSLSLAAPATADTVTDWNEIASNTISASVPARPAGAAPLLDFAMVHAAMHDAVQAYEKRFKPYAVDIDDASGSRRVAAAKAAHDVLAARFPLQKVALLALYDAYLVSKNLPAGDPGELVGQEAAVAIITKRANDGSYPANAPPDTGGMGPGEWRPTFPAFFPFSAPWLGFVERFTKISEEQFNARPHPPVTSREYARHYNEVKNIGCLACTDPKVGGRTAKQTDLAHFYSDNTILLWERTLRGIVDSRPQEFKKLGDSARLFALANLAAADAGMTAWYSKKYYNFWRPITAIQQLLPEDNDDNPRTKADAKWLPLITTPPYPDYTSGANNVTGSITRILALYFGTDKKRFSIRTLALAAVQKTRTYTRFSDAADDVVDVRVYQGIHFRFADEAARRQGTRVANRAFNHFLRPVHDHHHHNHDDCDDNGDYGDDDYD